MKETRIMQSDEIQASTDTYKINKTLKLNTVTKGEPTDNVLVHGLDNEVKSVPRSEFGGGGEIPTLQEVFDKTGNKAQAIYISPDGKKDVGMKIEAGNYSSSVSLASRYITSQGKLDILDGKVEISQLENIDSSEFTITKLGFETPIASFDNVAIINVPAKEGRKEPYTLAVKDDITLQKAIEKDNSTNLPIKFVGDYGFTTLSSHGLTNATDGSGFLLPRITDGEGQLDLLTEVFADSKYLQKELPLETSYQVYGISPVNVLPGNETTMFTVDDILSNLNTSLPSSFAVKAYADTKLSINSDPVGYPRVYAARGNGTQTMYNLQTVPITTSAGNVNAVPNVQVVKDYVDSSISALGLASGRYKPTVTELVNASGTFIQDAVYTKIGNIVTVKAEFGTSTVATGGGVTFEITLPTSKAGTSGVYCGSGTATAIVSGNSVLNPVVVIGGNATKARIYFTPIFSGSTNGTIIFTYDMSN